MRMYHKRHGVFSVALLSTYTLTPYFVDTIFNHRILVQSMYPSHIEARTLDDVIRPIKFNSALI